MMGRGTVHSRLARLCAQKDTNRELELQRASNLRNARLALENGPGPWALNSLYQMSRQAMALGFECSEL